MRTPKAADFARGWPRRVSEVKGLRVRLLRDAENRSMRFPQGAVGTLRPATSWFRLEFAMDPCECCKARGIISGLMWFDVEPIQ